MKHYRRWFEFTSGRFERVCGKSKRISGVCKNLVRVNCCPHAVSGPTRGDALLDIFFLRPESSLISCNILPRISDHNGILMEVEWDEIRREPEVQKIVPVYHKMDVLDLQAFLHE